MLNFTQTAKNKIKELIQGKDANDFGLLFKLDGENLELTTIDLTKLPQGVEPLRDKRTHFFMEHDHYMILVDEVGQKELHEGTVDYSDGGLLSGGFEYKKSLAAQGPDMSNPIVPEIQKLLDNEINPGLAMHGGFAELLNVLNDKVYLRFGGGCQGCSMIDATVKGGVEKRIKQIFPMIQAVVDETDHDAGTNPYFKG
ncbi:MAG: NifU family protein [Deltaproteobacteria bacterium]|nr:NifU family protein [Deltaproteobacteria bacterium]